MITTAGLPCILAHVSAVVGKLRIPLVDSKEELN